MSASINRTFFRMLAIDAAAANAVELFPSDGIVLVNMMTRDTASAELEVRTQCLDRFLIEVIGIFNIF